MLISRNSLDRDARTACPVLMCDTWKCCRILCRFQIWTQKYQIPDSKYLHFFTYANLCKLGHYVVDITFQHAKPPEDQICQASFLYHKLHRFYAKSAHQLLRSLWGIIVECQRQHGTLLGPLTPSLPPPIFPTPNQNVCSFSIMIWYCGVHTPNPLCIGGNEAY